jgi:DNA-directed RNA polymerase subunit RPC12/RpoP
MATPQKEYTCHECGKKFPRFLRVYNRKVYEDSLEYHQQVASPSCGVARQASKNLMFRRRTINDPIEDVNDW